MKIGWTIVFEITSVAVGEPTCWHGTCRLGTEITVNNEEIIEQFGNELLLHSVLVIGLVLIQAKHPLQASLKVELREEQSYILLWITTVQFLKQLRSFYCRISIFSSEPCLESINLHLMQEGKKVFHCHQIKGYLSKQGNLFPLIL